MDLVSPQINAYVSLLISSLKNLAVLDARILSDNASADKPLTNQHLYQLKVSSDTLNSQMQHLLKEIHIRLPRLTTYAVVDWK